MDSLTIHPEAADTVVFRPSKKRKIYRQRANDDLSDPASRSPTSLSLGRDPADAFTVQERVASLDAELEGTQVPMSEILRLRKLRKQRVGGVEFRAGGTTGRIDERQDGELVLHEHRRAEEENDEAQSGGGVVRRFARQTGMVGDVDKHMMAYIDSELAKRRLITNSPPSPRDGSSYQDPTPSAEPISQLTAPSKKPVAKQPAALGKLLEIDLGNEARDRNVVRTEQARRRLDGEVIEEEAAGDDGKPKKVKLGRDGKPRRDRKRRNSDDIRRDKLVEEVLRENRLEIYEPPPAPLATAAGDGEADDLIAEAFRREFMDAVTARQRKKPAATTTSSSTGAAGRNGVTKKEEEMLRGPKLGGSRSARAAMREAQLKELRAGKK